MQKKIFEVAFLLNPLVYPLAHNLMTLLFFLNFNSGHIREPREAVEASKMIIGHTQNINPDKDGVCSCPICPKGM